MILSRAEIPWGFARNPYDIHRALWRLFPGEPAEARRTHEDPRQGFLFRVEDNRPGRPALTLVQSRQPPRSDASVRVLGSREIRPQPSQGQRLAFILTANPVKTIKDQQLAQKPKKRRDSCRVPLIKDEDQRAWLERRLGEAATVEAVSITPHQPTFFRRRDRGGRIASVTFEGILEVKRTDALVALLENGIGPAKAFGCGLMLVRRLS